jgi:hypothetical protein
VADRAFFTGFPGQIAGFGRDLDSLLGVDGVKANLHLRESRTGKNQQGEKQQSGDPAIG